jgi:hypothetical protein
MSTPNCFGSLRLERLRLAILNDTTGAPSSGSTNGYVTDSQILVRRTPVIEEGEEFTQKNGAGRICQSAQDDSVLKRATLQVQLCEANPVLESFFTAGATFSSGGNVIGVQAPAAGTANTRKLCLEGWTAAWDGDAQAVPAYTSPNPAYWHWVWPLTRSWVFNDLDLGNGIHVFQFNGIAEENSAITANGPFNDWPAPVAGPGGVTRIEGRFLDATLPSVTCATISVPSGS